MESDELLIALFDVLGFSDRIGRSSLDKIHAQYRDLIAVAARQGSHVFLDARPAGDGTSVPYLGYMQLEQDFFSDTILLWSPYHPEQVIPFLNVCSLFMCETLETGLPLRGAISLGKAVMDKAERTYIGPPLVEAARVEKAQEWIGVSFGPSFRSRPDVPFRADLVRMYKKHGKPGTEALLPGLVLDWPRTWRRLHRASAIPLVEKLSYDRSSEERHEYYRQTIDFIRVSDENPDWWNDYLRSGA